MCRGWDSGDALTRDNSVGDRSALRTENSFVGKLFNLVLLEFLEGVQIGGHGSLSNDLVEDDE